MVNLGTDLSGTLIGEYQVLRRVGLGGMGVVYEGVQPLIGKRVAIKTLLPSVSADREMLQRFLNEARAVNAIRHRGIVDIFSFGTLADGTQYFVMEFLEGRDFARIIEQMAPVPTRVAVGWLLEIVEALHAAHQAGVVHRDLKPSNLFLVEQGTTSYVKVLDYGAAKTGVPREGREQSHVSVVIGTPEYIAPEQAQADAVSPKTDLYALGCVAFELVTGRLPYEDESPIQTMFKHVHAKVPRASALLPGLEQPLDDLIFELMAKEPDDRPDDDEVIRRLKELRAPRAVMDAPFVEPTVVQRFRPPPSRDAPGNYERTVVGREPKREPKAEPAPAPPMAPAPAPTVEVPVAPTHVTAPDPTRVTPSLSASRRFVPAALGFGAVMTAALIWAVARGALEPVVPPAATPPQPPSVATVEPREAPPPKPTEPPPSVTPPPALAPAVVAAPVSPARPPGVKKHAAALAGPTEAQLKSRLQALEERVAARERDRGRADVIGRNYLRVVEARFAEAKTPEQRREALRFIDEVDRELGGQPHVDAQ